MKKWLSREIYVAIHAQTVRFRIVKYLILIAIFTSLYLWQGWTVVWATFLILFVVAISIHFLFRWKTDGWRKSWWLYKKIDIPE